MLRRECPFCGETLRRGPRPIDVHAATGRVLCDDPEDADL